MIIRSLTNPARCTSSRDAAIFGLRRSNCLHQTAADFEQRISAGGELRMAVKRMIRGRIVKVSISAGGGEQETGPSPEAPG